MSPPPTAAPFQFASLVNTPSFPNAVVWSADNLIAVATGDIVTILNPANLQGPRGVINVVAEKPFSVGVIDRDDLPSGCLLPTRLARDRQPCVRSISWSPVGYSPNNGCLLAVCTTEGRVKVYREPSCEFQAEWIEVMDISALLHGHLVKTDFRELETSLLPVVDDSTGQTLAEGAATADITNLKSTRETKRRRVDGNYLASCTQKINPTYDIVLYESNAVNVVEESLVFESSLMQKGSPVEVFDMDGEQHFWRAGRLLSFEGSRVLVQFCEADENGEEHWFETDSTISMNNQHNLYAAVEDYTFPQIRPSMNIAHLPEQIFMVKHKVGEILKARQVLEVWARDRWLEGIFVGFADGQLMVELSGDAEIVTLHPNDVRFPPLWNAQEKSWKVTAVRVLNEPELPEVKVNKTSKAKGNNSLQIKSGAKGKKTPNRRAKNNTDDVIEAHQYASRSSMLASLVLAWSPVLRLSADDADNSCECFCLLAVGTKSGTISIWKFNRPLYYSVEQHDDPMQMVFVGVLHAQSAWVTALSWTLLASDSSPQALLVSGGSDGSVKIWLARVCDFKRSFQANQTPFSLFSQITVGDNALVSTLSLCIPSQSRQKILVAVGKGSGSFEVWMLNIVTKRLKKVGSYDAHVQAVTGLAWAFGGHCLYSCSQDNSTHGWILHKGALFKASIPPNNPGIRSSSDFPSVSDSSYGVALSPANLVLAVARRFDAGQLDHMYQKRTQKAAVEFFWIGGQEFKMSPHINLKLDIDLCPWFTKEELFIWGSKLLWSLNHYESYDKPLVVWDALAALLAFKQCATEFIEYLILSWLASSTNDTFSDLPGHMSLLSSRQLQLINVLCRRVMVSSGRKVAKGSSMLPNLAESYDVKDEEKWLNILLSSEKELRERLVGFSLSTVLTHLSHPAPEDESGRWNPVGIAQMVEWVMQNQDNVQHELNLMAAEVRGLAERISDVCDYTEEEHCCYCSASIPFESPEVAFCKGDGEAPQKHKHTRCAVSMQVCPLTPLWFCMCCRRRASYLPPNQLHTTVNRPSDFSSFIKPLLNRFPTPLCPFCGISLQRLQPDFLLSKSPV
ncbi:hypothetical protein RND81_12G096000 [Saponaria officinalis]|uniref:Transcription factor IIIC 90kDa subunit N-terminal domain-containing protein n=1 Tax=Saponaria officinalis TaxID=3572 RepID=A0AAW1H8J6_SAPOF